MLNARSGLTVDRSSPIAAGRRLDKMLRRPPVLATAVRRRPGAAPSSAKVRCKVVRDVAHSWAPICRSSAAPPRPWTGPPMGKNPTAAGPMDRPVECDGASDTGWLTPVGPSNATVGSRIPLSRKIGVGRTSVRMVREPNAPRIFLTLYPLIQPSRVVITLPTNGHSGGRGSETGWVSMVFPTGEGWRFCRP
jgi:hypothetical protein